MTSNGTLRGSKPYISSPDTQPTRRWTLRHRHPRPIFQPSLSESFRNRLSSQLPATGANHSALSVKAWDSFRNLRRHITGRPRANHCEGRCLSRLKIDSHVCIDCDCHDLCDLAVGWNWRDVNGRDEVAGRAWGGSRQI